MSSLSKKAGWALQQVVPPALLTYFAWRICAFEIGPELIGKQYGLGRLGVVYSVFATASIASMVSLYLQLYFLPRSQSVPPRDPPAELLSGPAIYECLSPAEEKALNAASLATDADADGDSPTDNSQLSRGSVNRCYRQTCNGRWKPARARHCSTCGTCRMGFDHHCAVFANCLTVAHVPCFLCMVVLVPPTIFILSSPLLIPLAKRGVQAWRAACTDPDVVGWWTWTPSWIVAGGPVGRWIGGLVLGWRQLDRLDGGGAVRASVAALVGIGGLISTICLGLAYTAISLIRSGRFTIDRERARMHSRSIEALKELEKRGRPVPDSVRQNIEKWAERRWFSVPTPEGGRVVLPTLPHEQAYDLGRENWRFVVCSEYGWLLPWRALRLGLGEQDMMSWPLNPDVEERLRRAAAAGIGDTRPDDLDI